MLFTIKDMNTVEQKLSRSRFICTLYPVDDLAKARAAIAEHNKAFCNATHNCYAYVLGGSQEIQYYSDAGEPGGTAGKPILNSLLRASLTNVLAIVTRYYGGVKLGVKGLIEAYGSSVDLAVEATLKIEYRQTVKHHLKLNYNVLDQVKHLCSSFEAEIIILEYQERVLADVSVPEENAEALLGVLDGFASNGDLHYLHLTD